MSGLFCQFLQNHSTNLLLLDNIDFKTTYLASLIFSKDILTYKKKKTKIVFEIYLKGPFSSGIFSPGVGCHKWPFCEAIPGIIVVGSGTQNHGPKFGKKILVKISSNRHYETGAETETDLVPIGDLENNSKSPLRVEFTVMRI